MIGEGKAETMRKLLTYVLALAMAGLTISGSPVFAEESVLQEPEQIVKSTMDEVVEILDDPTYVSLRKNETLNQRQIELREEYRRQIRDLLIARLDIERVADLTLAREKDKFDADQRERFEKLFAELLFTTYIQHVEKYSGQPPDILGTKKVSPNPADSRIWVQTVVTTNGRQTPIDYGLYRTESTWMIYDVQIEGLSLVQNYRSQFREILIKEKTGQPLLDRIEKRVEDNRKGIVGGA